MARGDGGFFNSYIQKSQDGVAFDMNAGDVLKMGIVTNVIIPTVGTADPRWGALGTTNFLANQVPLALAYTGPITLTNVVFTRTAAVTKLDFDNITVAADAGGFTTGYFAIFFNDTVAGKYCFAYYDLGGPVSILNGILSITIPAAGFATITSL